MPLHPCSGQATPMDMGFVVLHLGHFSFVTSFFSTTTSIFPFSSFLKFFVFLQCGYAEHARNFPFLPHFITITLPHFSHLISVGVSSFFMSFISFSAFFRLSLKGP